MADDITRWSDELARDPANLVFLMLGEALRKQNQLGVAHRVAVKGLERHPHHADAHDLLARILVDLGDFDQAFDEWDMTLRLAPGHVGALKGMGFVRFKQGRLPEAEEYLRRASGDATMPDVGASQALRTVRQSGAFVAPVPAPVPVPEEEPATLFARVLTGAGQTALLMDASGLVMAGSYLLADGSDVASEVGAALSGVSDEADRATRHLNLGEWTAILVETEAAVIAMAPAAEDGLLLLAASRATPLGLLKRLLGRCRDTAREWMEGRPS
ncbi:MAG: hypothetical protein JWO05_2293 [Gemmatimonadetes bacterium]|nr:hypothetical protein [Gemmatimonadota bacterium]